MDKQIISDDTKMKFKIQRVMFLNYIILIINIHAETF